MRRIILTEIQGYGFLATIEEDVRFFVPLSARECYRGEYQSTPEEALKKALLHYPE